MFSVQSRNRTESQPAETAQLFLGWALRSIYTGHIHSTLIDEFAFGAALYFGEILMQSPFVHPATMNKKFRPDQHPEAFRMEVLNALWFFLKIIPLVDAGLVNLIPEPWDFDFYLRDRTLALAEARSDAYQFKIEDDVRFVEFLKQQHARNMLMLPDASLREEMKDIWTESPTPSDSALKAIFKQMREKDPLAVLQRSKSLNGQLQPLKMAPNFEMAMYLAQATGANIVTDSTFRWRELQAALNYRYLGAPLVLQSMAGKIRSVPFAFPGRPGDIIRLHGDSEFGEMRSILQGASSYLQKLPNSDRRPNYENQLEARISRSQRAMAATIGKVAPDASRGRVTGIFRAGGLQDNSINRLLLLSNSEPHLQHVPMAFHISRV